MVRLITVSKGVLVLQRIVRRASDVGGEGGAGGSIKYCLIVLPSTHLKGKSVIDAHSTTCIIVLRCPIKLFKTENISR